MTATLLVAVVLARAASGFLWPIPFQVDEAQYLGWSRDLAAGYFSKPPLIAWVLAFNSGACGFFGVDAIEGCARMSQSFALGGAAIFSGLAAWALFRDKSVALAVVMLLALSPLFGFYSLYATTDAWLLLCWSASLWLFIAAVRADGIAAGAWIACGVMVGFGLLAKYSMGVFVLSALIWLLLERRLFTVGPWMAAMAALLVFLPNLIWNIQTGFPTFVHHIDISKVGELAASDWSMGDAMVSMLQFVLAQFLMVGPFALGFALLSKPRFSSHSRNEFFSPGILPLVFSLPMFAIMIAQSFMSRAHANWAAPAYIGLAIYVAWLWFGRRRNATNPNAAWLMFLASLAFGFLMSVAVAAVPKVAFHVAGGFEMRATEKLRGWKEVALWSLETASNNQLAIIAQERSLIAAMHAYGGNKAPRIYAFDASGSTRNHYTWFNNIKDVPADGNHYLFLSFDPPSQEMLAKLKAEVIREFDAPLLADIAIGERKAKIRAYEVSRQRQTD